MQMLKTQPQNTPSNVFADTIGSALANALGELLSPTRCVVCERPGSLICETCSAEIVRIDPAQSCTHCGAPYGRMLCTECDGSAKPYDRCLAATVFEGPPSRIVRAYKDRGEQRLAELIARYMYESACAAQEKAPERYGGILSQADALIFVPATAAAYNRRGFDHMELVAQHLSNMTGIPVIDGLAKYGHTDQRKLDRQERLTQSSGAYTVVAPQQIKGANLLLIDDVITTGATLQEAAATLMRAGAARVDALGFARVWVS